jgi:hypothetical protein
MRTGEFLAALALMTISLVSAKANLREIGSDPLKDEPQPTPEVATNITRSAGRISEERMEVDRQQSLETPPLLTKDKVLGSTYLNTLSILSAKNACSDFFGGPTGAVDVFKQLARKIRKGYFETSLSMQMSGEIVNVHDQITGTDYRLFDKVSVNANGPFYRKRNSQSEPQLHGVGSFEPNTKEARVLIFLHELGHVIKGEDGNWLLPNDGGDDALSRQNSQKIQHVCGAQIQALPEQNIKQ